MTNTKPTWGEKNCERCGLDYLEKDKGCCEVWGKQFKQHKYMIKKKSIWEEEFDDEYNWCIVRECEYVGKDNCFHATEDKMKDFIKKVEQEAYERGYKDGVSYEGGKLIGEPFRESETVTLTPEQAKNN